MAEKREMITLTDRNSLKKHFEVDFRSNDGPLPDLTKDQLTVLHTLMLCSGEYVGCINDATIGNINVLKTINELQNKGFVAVTTTYRFLFGNRIQVLLRLHNGYCCSISFGQQYQLMRYYVTKYLYNDMEKDFFLSVASDRCLQLYANTHVHSSSEQNCPITLMRLIVEREVKGLQLEDILPPYCESLTKTRNFVLDWCQKEKIDPLPWTDKVPNERLKSFYSASTIRPPSDKDTNCKIPKYAQSILFCILLASGYSIAPESDNWRRKFAKIREEFCMSETRAEHEDLEIIKELVGKLALLTKTGHRITFKSENIKHEVMADFVIHCLRTDKNYESYLKLTSEDSIIEYCTFWEYRNLTNERCLYIPKFLEDLLMEKLKILAVLYNKNIWYTGIDKEKISRTYDIPLAVFDIDDVALLARFVEFVIQKGIDRANLNSILCSIFIFHQTVRSEDDFHKGSHEHFSDKSRVLPYNLLRRVRQLYISPKNDPESRDTDVLNQQMYIDGGIQNLSLSPKEWAILIFILLADDYLITIDRLSETKQRSMQQAFPLLQDVTLLSEIEYMTQLGKYDNVLTIDKDKGIIRFASDEIRHQVMSYFVLNCLKTDEDYKNYIRLSSVDSLLEYVRRWWPERVGKERCLYLTGTLEDDFIENLGIDALRHVMVETRDQSYMKESIFSMRSMDLNKVRKIVQKKFKIPWEIFDLDYEARCRYVVCAKKGTQTIHRARAMIVGCVGAGKTTLLKRLQKCSQDEITNVKPTLGLEIHQDIFEITDEENVLKALQEESKKEGKQLLSIIDFAGQYAYDAYYVCHQVYMIRRAFYLLVIDMSKPFSERVDPKLCKQEKTMCTNWTYGEYLVVWMKSIHAYSDNDTRVIIVGTHLDKTNGQTSDTLYNKVLEHLEFNEELTKHLDRKRCYVLDFQTKTGQYVELEKCIVSITKENRWKEAIPKDWAL